MRSTVIQLDSTMERDAIQPFVPKDPLLERVISFTEFLMANIGECYKPQAVWPALQPVVFDSSSKEIKGRFPQRTAAIAASLSSLMDGFTLSDGVRDDDGSTACFNTDDSKVLDRNIDQEKDNGNSNDDDHNQFMNCGSPSAQGLSNKEIHNPNHEEIFNHSHEEINNDNIEKKCNDLTHPDTEMVPEEEKCLHRCEGNNVATGEFNLIRKRFVQMQHAQETVSLNNCPTNSCQNRAIDKGNASNVTDSSDKLSNFTFSGANDKENGSNIHGASANEHRPNTTCRPYAENRSNEISTAKVYEEDVPMAVNHDGFPCQYNSMTQHSKCVENLSQEQIKPDDHKDNCSSHGGDTSSIAAERDSSSLFVPEETGRSLQDQNNDDIFNMFSCNDPSFDFLEMDPSNILDMLEPYSTSETVCPSKSSTKLDSGQDAQGSLNIVGEASTKDYTVSDILEIADLPSSTSCPPTSESVSHIKVSEMDCAPNVLDEIICTPDNSLPIHTIDKAGVHAEVAHGVSETFDNSEIPINATHRDITYVNDVQEVAAIRIIDELASPPSSHLKEEHPESGVVAEENASIEKVGTHADVAHEVLATIDNSELPIIEVSDVAHEVIATVDNSELPIIEVSDVAHANDVRVAAKGTIDELDTPFSSHLKQEHLECGDVTQENLSENVNSGCDTVTIDMSCSGVHDTKKNLVHEPEEGTIDSLLEEGELSEHYIEEVDSKNVINEENDRNGKELDSKNTINEEHDRKDEELYSRNVVKEEYERKYREDDHLQPFEGSAMVNEDKHCRDDEMNMPIGYLFPQYFGYLPQLSFRTNNKRSSKKRQLEDDNCGTKKKKKKTKKKNTSKKTQGQNGHQAMVEPTNVGNFSPRSPEVTKESRNSKNVGIMNREIQKAIEHAKKRILATSKVEPVKQAVDQENKCEDLSTQVCAGKGDAHDVTKLGTTGLEKQEHIKQSGTTAESQPEGKKGLLSMAVEDLGLWSNDAADDQNPVDVKKPRKLTKERKKKKKARDRLKRRRKDAANGIRKLRLKPNVIIQKPKEKEKVIKICDFYMNGKCSKGTDCKFSHDCTPKTKSEMCKYFVNRCCLKGEDCPFSHDLSSFPCKYFHLRRNCLDGNTCRFSHEAISEETRQNLQRKMEQEQARQGNILSGNDSNLHHEHLGFGVDNSSFDHEITSFGPAISGSCGGVNHSYGHMTSSDFGASKSLSFNSKERTTSDHNTLLSSAHTFSQSRRTNFGAICSMSFNAKERTKQSPDAPAFSEEGLAISSGSQDPKIRAMEILQASLAASQQNKKSKPVVTMENPPNDVTNTSIQDTKARATEFFQASIRGLKSTSNTTDSTKDALCKRSTVDSLLSKILSGG